MKRLPLVREGLFCYNKPHMETLYDVQQLLKHYGIIVYMGKRLYDIELMKIELAKIYEAGLIERQLFMQAELVLRREHRLEMEQEHGKKTSGH